MKALLHPTYLPNIAHFIAIAQTKEVTFEADDNYQKQTYRNRSYIYGANGKLQLSVPIIHSQKERQKYRDIKIYNEENWQLQHWKSLETAYRTSPYFEYYEDELHPLFTTKADFLFDYNIKCLECICECLQLDLNFSKTEIYIKSPTDVTDFRALANARKETKHTFETYNQVFTTKHGYINNLSIIDLLCNEGPNAVNYLEAQTLS